MLIILEARKASLSVEYKGVRYTLAIRKSVAYPGELFARMGTDRIRIRPAGEKAVVSAFGRTTVVRNVWK